MEKSFSVLDFLMIFLVRKKRIALHFLVVVVLSVGVSFLIPKNYKATALFLPPYDDASGFTFGAVLNIGKSSAFTPQQIETLLDSRRILEATVQKFHLIDLYKTRNKPNKNEAALKVLKQCIIISSQMEKGLTQNTVVNFSLSVIDKDRQRAADMANFIVDELGRAMNDLSKGYYSYSETFIRGRLDSVEAQKNTVQRDLAAFQKANKVYSPNIDRQVLASVSAYADLKQQKILSEIQREVLLVDRNSQSQEVRLLDTKIRELSSKMKEIEQSRTPSVMPGLEYSVDIAYQYVNMIQELEVLVKLEVLLRQQYEEARIKSARAAPSVRIVDRAKPPEWKNSPKKAIIVLSLVGGYMIMLFLYILGSHGMARATPETARKLAEFRQALGFRSR